MRPLRMEGLFPSQPGTAVVWSAQRKRFRATAQTVFVKRENKR